MGLVMLCKVQVNNSSSANASPGSGVVLPAVGGALWDTDLLMSHPSDSMLLLGYSGRGEKGSENRPVEVSDGSRSLSFPLGNKAQASRWCQVL